MTWSHTMRVSAILFVALVISSIIVLGNQRPVSASCDLSGIDQSNLADLAPDIICVVYECLGSAGLPPGFDTNQCSGTPPEPGQCEDGINNDADGLIDSADPNCHTDGDPNNSGSYDGERNEDDAIPGNPQCWDGDDNDQDGKTDWNPISGEGDPDCSSPLDTDEQGEVTPPPGQCEDGLDNDEDSFTDSEDPNCHTDGDPDNSATYDGDRNEDDAISGNPQCWDGLDNDNDGKTDWGVPGDENADPDCSSPLDTSEEGENGGGGGEQENTLALCSDTLDNDSDSLVDLADPDCAGFMPQLVVVKVVVNDNQGTSTVSDFTLYIATSSATTTVSSGATTTVSAGTWTVGEMPTDGYTATFGGDCSTTGTVTLAAGETKTCVITNNDVAPTPLAQCADGIDNDSDGKIDLDDPGCSSASDDDETDPQNNGGGSSSGGGGGGGGGGGIVLGLLGAQTGQVLGAATTTAPATCSAYLTAFIKYGAQNDRDQVLRLQNVLKNFEGANIEMTGVYDAPTLAALRAFQLKYAAEVLTPWGLTAPTGYTYLTTRKKINEIFCQGTRSFPLSTTEQAIIEAAKRPSQTVRPRSASSAPPAPMRATPPAPSASPEPVAPAPTPTISPEVESQVSSAVQSERGMFRTVRDLLRKIFWRD